MTNSPSDEDLVERTLEGEEDAFSQLYDRYRGAVYATAYRITQNPEEAQDATQEIFIKLYRSLSGWDASKAKFSTWLYRLAANHAIDCWRSRRRRAESPLESDEYLSSVVAGSQQRDLEHQEKVEEIRRCVSTLPDLQKKVFVLRYFQELKLEEIAKLEKCSLGTIKTSLFRATQAVRRRLRKSRGS